MARDKEPEAEQQAEARPAQRRPAGETDAEREAREQTEAIRQGLPHSEPPKQ